MTAFGTYLNPFAANSFWNCRPISPVLGTWEIPATFKPRGSTYKCFPLIAGGAWSTGVYKALPSHPARTIYPPAGTAGVYDSDTDTWRPSITIPHWPDEAIGAVGSDGHCDVIDEAAGVVHSFWILKPDATGRLTARQYGWSPLKGQGWGDPAHFYQGARATGVPTCAGMIRKHEVSDGKSLFEHALAMSLDQTGLAASPAYIAPATLSDWNPWVNTGNIPQGALLMLPAGYDTARLARWPLLKKVAETLKVYGARVVDRNEYTSFAIYVENGSGWKMTDMPWDNDMVAELEVIRSQLRQVVSHGGYIDGNGQPRVPPPRENILSMRGPWYNTDACVNQDIYDSLNQRVQLPVVSKWTRWVNANSTGFKVPEFKPKAGNYYKMVVDSDCGASFNVVLKRMVDGKAVEIYNSGLRLHNSLTFFQWPENVWSELYVSKSVGSLAGYIRPRIVKIDEAEFRANRNTP